MKNLNYTLLLMFLVFSVLSCSDDIDESLETEESSQLSAEAVTIKSLDEINNQLLFEQLPNSKQHLKKIIRSDFEYLLTEHNVENLLLDTKNIFVENTSDITSYTFVATIPHIKGDETLNQYAYLTLNFTANRHIDNQMSIGFQMDHFLSFDGDGNMINDDTSNAKYYTPKPSNLPSKAPKSVICNYAVNEGINYGPIATYCGTYGGETVPAPQSVLDALFASNLTHNYNDLYILSPSNPNGQIPFSSYYSYYFPSLKNEIIAYYQKVWISQLGYSLSVSGNITADQHVNKQAFIDSFYTWLFTMQNVAPSTFNYLTANPQVLYQLFNFFADYNLAYSQFEGVYLGLMWGEYAPNLDIRCVTLGNEYLLTPAGLTLLQQLGAGSITIEQFRSQLPACS